MPPTDIQPIELPAWYWGMVFFIFGAIFGSLANVCIHRMPRDESIVAPRSHCPRCGYLIPWFHNIPLVSWVRLQGRCANCHSPISPRYFLVELLTGVAFLSCWLAFGDYSPAGALAFSAVMFGFICATFIDIEHFIIPDEFTIGAIAAGFLACTAVPIVPQLPFIVHYPDLQPFTRAESMKASAAGIALGGGLIYAILRAGKLLFGRRNVEFAPHSKLVFTETHLHLPEETLAYEEIFYRKSDTIILHANRVEIVDRCYVDVPVRLSPVALHIGNDEFAPENVHHMEVIADRIVLPREAMGFGDVKFMAGIGAFIGWPGVIFTLTVSALLGSIVGVAAIALRKQDWSSRIPYGPYIALAATLWIFQGPPIAEWWFEFCGRFFGGPLPPGMSG